jgi:hypothetical protein
MKKNEYPPCDVCAGVEKTLLMFQKDLPPEMARGKALREFEEIHDDSVCLEFLTCLPIQRLRYGPTGMPAENSAGKKRM